MRFQLKRRLQSQNEPLLLKAFAYGNQQDSAQRGESWHDTYFQSSLDKIAQDETCFLAAADHIALHSRPSARA
ncbi:hypothetical protein SAMN06265373_10527 [Shimia sagamensis]|uniref:Uncharacterized protein n=1 Tax=Shimia sagamensis TaxID=1566352 RepID=A0ABY1P3P3_9RHOB|nr:hypothetical protein SAMN06265373_10527 [Shimia sagamensis]